MRHLSIIPIIHSPADLGRLQGKIAHAKHQTMSESTIDSNRDKVQQFWAQLKIAITGWQQDFSTVQVYQDALPVGPSHLPNVEIKIVNDLAAKGSVNHQLLKWIADCGGQLIGTEDPSLLIREYQLAKQTLMFYDRDYSASQDDFDKHCQQQHDLLEARDAFIAERINTTLLDNHLGLIFLGMLHHLESHLPSDIMVSYPFGRPSNERVMKA